MFSLLYGYGIGTYSFDSENPTDEIEVYRNHGIITIRFSKFCPESKLRYRLAHEFGHILLDGLRYGENKQYRDLQADCFARHLLVPSVILAEQRLHSTEEISEFFGIQREIAEIAKLSVGNAYFYRKFFPTHYEHRYAKLYTEHKKFSYSAPYWDL